MHVLAVLQHRVPSYARWGHDPEQCKRHRQSGLNHMPLQAAPMRESSGLLSGLLPLLHTRLASGSDRLSKAAAVQS